MKVGGSAFSISATVVVEGITVGVIDVFNSD